MRKKGKLVYQFHIILRDSNPSIWRRFQVEADDTLHRLSSTILEVMGWAGGHLHQFYIGGKFYSIPYEAGERFTETLDERKVKIVDIDEKDISEFEYEYDMGDGWEHKLILEDVLEKEKDTQYPVCIEGARNCPPEDCGGIPGYEEFLQAIRDPKHPEHKSMLDWIGEEFDPEEFDIEKVNESLKEVNEMESFFDELSDKI